MAGIAWQTGLLAGLAKAGVDVGVADFVLGTSAGSVVAVEAQTAEPALFDRSSGVDLVDAVAASCAVPAVWPPVTIGAHRYVDGGVRSINNVDLAEGHDRVLLVAVFVDPVTATQIESLTAQGATVEVITPDDHAIEVIMSDPLAPENRLPAANAGLAQAESVLAAAIRWLG